MNNFKITNVFLPFTPTHVATKEFVNFLFNQLGTELLTHETGDSNPEPDESNRVATE